MRVRRGPWSNSTVPNITTQNTSKPSTILLQSVSVTPFRATPSRVVQGTSVHPTPAPIDSYVQVVTSSLHPKPNASKPNLDSSMLHKLSSNSYHVLEEVTPPDKENHEEDAQLLDHPIPPDKDPFSVCINDFKFEDEADCLSPSSPTVSPIECYSSDLPSSGRSKKQLKKAKKIARQKSSSFH